MTQPNPRINVRTLQTMKKRGEKIAMLTAYDYPTAQLLDQAGVHCLLVGDSLGMVVQGHETTIPVTLEQMIYHGSMVARAAQHALVVVDLPFPVGQISIAHTVRAAAKIMKHTQCQAVKMEGGHQQADSIRALVDAGIPTIAHIGLRPQSVHALGGYRVQKDAQRLMKDAQTAQDAGAFCVLMECVPAELAKEVTQNLVVPTIGIGAGPHCDGQVLVTNDMLGWNSGYVPKFVRKFRDLRTQALDAVKEYCTEIQDGSFPGPAESF
ncbi:MAG: 3-methyl-2-oxobutanoate hydroxymethyltransferase [Pirellula sp.]|jgi:3-methyl-2-oxobutanoate hydroxymethyltransferase|nr:3-methyl-2-oxobutanoate hydroxymethyltransferase [Planctomycetota bacterium]